MAMNIVTGNDAGTTLSGTGGGDLIYGAQYARVMVRTWCREYVLRGRRR